jgi:hypothetical protein
LAELSPDALIPAKIPAPINRTASTMAMISHGPPDRFEDGVDETTSAVGNCAVDDQPGCDGGA